MKKQLYLIFSFIIIFILMLNINNIKAKTNEENLSVHGKVIKIYNNENKEVNKPKKYSNIEVKIISGSHKGEKIIVQDFINERTSSGNLADKGDEVLLSLEEDEEGKIIKAYIYEIVRYKHAFGLIIIFAFLLISIGGIKGIKSIITLIITGILVLKILIPLIFKGFDAIILSVIISIIIIITSLVILNGKNKKTLAAIIGTTGGIMVAGIIALYFSSAINLRGLTDEEIQNLIYLSRNSNFNFKGLLFSGILMGALGAVMDVSMSIASSMNEIKESVPDISVKDLIKSGMNVGRDVMGTMSNTLILAYAGGSMYIMILIYSYGMSLFETINQDIISSEILKALAGSIGLILSIPITALAYAVLVNLEDKFFNNEKESA